VEWIAVERKNQAEEALRHRLADGGDGYEVINQGGNLDVL